MINVISQPPGIVDFNDPIVPPIPLSDCMSFCLQPDVSDVFLTTGIKPKIVFVIPFSCTVPPDGTAFKIWGFDFTVESAEPFTSASFKVEATGLFTALNLANMLYSNVFFKRAGMITSFVIVGSSFEMTFTWSDCREQINFAGANMDLAVFTTIGGSATETNGVSPVYVDAFRIVVNAVRYKDATHGFYDLGALVGMEVEKLCNTAGVVCVDIRHYVAADLFTMIPALTYDSFISSIDNGRSMMKYFSLQYGWTYRENCIAKSGTIKQANKIMVLNAAFDIDDPYQMRRYWYNHPDGFPPGQFVPEFLTTQPKEIPLCRNSFKWLWLLNAWQDDWLQYALVARFVLYDSTGTIISIVKSVVNDPLFMGSSPYQPVCFNASPRHISDVLGVPLTGVAFYEVQVIGTNPLDHNEVWFNASEYLRFNICDACCDDLTDLFFLSPTGSIDTIVVRIDSIETLQSGGEEIMINVSCGTDRVDRATYGGRTLVSVRVYQKLKMSVQIPRSSEWERWVKHLRQSPQRWVRMLDEGGTYIAKKIVFENGAFTQRKTGEGTTIEMIGFLQDVPTQSANDKKM